MDFNFYEEYKKYSDEQLLNIIAHAHQYQSGAVVAARHILQERNITVGEREKMVIANSEIGYPGALKYLEKKYGRSLLILFTITAIYYGWHLYKIANRFVRFAKYDLYKVDLIFIFNIIGAVFIIFALILFYKQKKLGWILLFSIQLYSFLCCLGTANIFFKYFYPSKHSSIFLFLFPICFSLIFIMLMWSNDIIQKFSVTHNVRKWTVIVTSSVALLNLITGYVFIYL